MAESQDYIFKNPDLVQNLEKMLDNPRYSDTVFLVNKSKLHVSSHLVCFSSSVLESMLDTHHENCGDREIRIGQIKYIESFSVILKFIYGTEINFTQTKKAVLCEVLCLSDRFKLTSLSKELKSYLSQIEYFQLDSIVVLLNTAKQFHLSDLYERLTIFAYKNTYQLVIHETFVDLQYDILLDLLKADCFCTREIDILRGALNWHGNNMSTRSALENDTGNFIDKEIEVAEDFKKVCDNKDISQGRSDSNADDNEDPIPAAQDKSVQLLKAFSKNILKSLLSHIRFPRISVVEIYKMSETDLFTKYKEFLSDCKYFSPSSERRIKYIDPELDIEKEVWNITQKFTVKLACCGVMYESEEEYLLNGMKWKVCLTDTVTISNNGYSNFTVEMYLKCISDELKDWECTAEYQLKMIPVNTSTPTLFTPSKKTHSSITLTSDNSCVPMGTFYYCSNSWTYSSNNCIYTFEVHFDSIYSKVKVDQNLSPIDIQK